MLVCLRSVRVLNVHIPRVSGSRHFRTSIQFHLMKYYFFITALCVQCLICYDHMKSKQDDGVLFCCAAVTVMVLCGVGNNLSGVCVELGDGCCDTLRCVVCDDNG